METRENILSRRSIRKYTDQPISKEDLQEILEAGTWAPSAVNLQPWYFVAIHSKEELAKMAEVMQRVADGILPNLKKRFANAPAVVDETYEFVRGLGDAPVYILAFQLKPDYKVEADAVNLSIGAAIQNILLAAHDKGIGSCWLTAPIEAGVGKELGEVFAPDKGEMVALITLGYPAKVGKAPKRKEGRFEII